MDNNEAKFILGAYRPGGADAADPAFADALAHARRDPALSAWLKSEQSFDRSISAKLRAVEPPSGLRESILAGAKMSRPAPARGARWRWLGLAAALLVAVGAGAVWKGQRAEPQRDELATWVAREIATGRHNWRFDGSVQTLQNQLSNPATQLARFSMPLQLEELESAGCRTARFAGRDVFEICFQREGHTYHLYIMRRCEYVPTTPQIVEAKGVSTAVWSDAQHSYALIANAGTEALRRAL